MSNNGGTFVVLAGAELSFMSTRPETPAPRECNRCGKRNASGYGWWPWSE